MRESSFSLPPEFNSTVWSWERKSLKKWTRSQIKSIWRWSHLSAINPNLTTHPIQVVLEKASAESLSSFWLLIRFHFLLLHTCLLCVQYTMCVYINYCQPFTNSHVLQQPLYWSQQTVHTFTLIFIVTPYNGHLFTMAAGTTQCVSTMAS